MTASQDQEKTPLSLKAFVLGGMLILCAALSGTAFYAKANLDKAQNVTTAPDSSFALNEDLYEKTIIALGYGGFLGAAQNFIEQHDRAALSDMRMNYKTAQEVLLRVGDKASTPVRRDIHGILDLFASIITRAESSGEGVSSGLSTSDLLAATAALNTLDARLASARASERIEAQERATFWSLMLLFLAIGSAGLAATLAAWALWSMSGRREEDLDKMAQSVANLVHGDSQKAIWGIERSDKLGALARTIDLARMYFTQVPDVAMASPDGPIRMKFEGEARSLFQVMLKKMTESFERAQQSSLGMTGTMNAQQELLRSLVLQMQTALDEVRTQGQAGTRTIQALSNSLADAATTLAQTHEKSASRLGDLVPMMQERIQNMAEVTHLAGTQVTQSLQKLMISESSLRQSATQSQQVVKQLAQAGNQIGERMFAALNLMQATSKALGDTIDSSQTRFNEAVDALTRGETNMTQILSRAEERLASSVNAEESMATLVARTTASAEKLETVVGTISDRHEKVDEQILTAAHRMDAIVANFDSAQRAMNESSGQIRRDGALLANLLTELRSNNDQLLSSLSQNSQTSFNAAQSFAEKSHALMQRLEVQIGQQAQMADTRIEELTSHSQTMAQQTGTTTAALAQAVTSLKTEQDKLATSRAKFTETLGDLGQKLEDQATSTFGKTEQWAAQTFSKISSITEQMESFMARINMLGQLTGTLGTVAGQLGQLVPTLTAAGNAMPALQSNASEPVAFDMSETQDLIVTQTADVIGELQKQWHEAVVQIEAMHDQLAQLVMQQKDQLETRLVVMDKKLRETSLALEDNKERIAADEKQAEIIDEVIAAVSKINQHVRELDDVIEESGIRRTGGNA